VVQRRTSGKNSEQSAVRVSLMTLRENLSSGWVDLPPEK
jgi:hypothetical protein